jgi:RNA-directed DNA polymerase
VQGDISDPMFGLARQAYGRFRRSVLDALLARINHHVEKWIRRKYRRMRPYRAMKRAWNRITTQTPGLLPHWRWVTGAWY